MQSWNLTVMGNFHHEELKIPLCATRLTDMKDVVQSLVKLQSSKACSLNVNEHSKPN